MRPYVHNPNVFRNHFGQGLPGFKGTRIQRGHGLSTKLKRFAVPLLLAGAKAAGPHLENVVRSVAKGAVRRVFPGNPAMERIAGNLASHVTSCVLKGSISKRKTGTRVRRPTKRRASTRKSIFA